MTPEQINAAVSEYNYTLIHLSERLANMAALVSELRAQLKAKDETKPKLEAV